MAGIAATGSTHGTIDSNLDEAPSKHEGFFGEAYHSSQYASSSSDAVSSIHEQEALSPKDIEINKSSAIELLKQKDVLVKLQKIQEFEFLDDLATAKLGLADEVFHVVTPTGHRLTVAGQRSLDHPNQIHVRIPGTEELTQFTLKQGHRDKNLNFIYTLPEYHFDSNGKLLVSSAHDDVDLEDDVQTLFDFDAYSNLINQDQLYDISPVLERVPTKKHVYIEPTASKAEARRIKKEAAKAIPNDFDFPRRERIPLTGAEDEVLSPSDQERTEVLEKLERNVQQSDKHFIKGIKNLSLGGTHAKPASPDRLSDFPEFKADIKRDDSSVISDTSDSDNESQAETVVNYDVRTQALIKKYDLSTDENGRVKLPYATFHDYTNPRETNRFNSSQGLSVLASITGVSADLIQKLARNPLLNLSGSFSQLNEKLFNQEKIHIVSAGAGHTAIGSALYTVFEPSGQLKRRISPVDGSDITQPKYKFTFIDPSDDFGGLAYKVGKGCLGGAAASATKTNTPVSHLQFGVIGFSYRDYLMQKIVRLKSEEAEKARTNFDLKGKNTASGLPKVKGLGQTLFDRIRKSINSTELEKTERLLKINFDPEKANRIDRMLFRYRDNPNFKFFQASAKDKPNSQKIWEGQGEREDVCAYGKWVIDKLKEAGVEIEFIKGSVTACDVDDKLNAVYTYNGYSADGVKENLEIKGDLGMIAIGQGPLKIAPQVKDLAENHKDKVLTYDDLMPDAQHVADLIASNPGQMADDAVRAYGEKWLGLKLAILGTGIAFEEVEPVLAIMTKLCQNYEKQRGVKLLPNRPLDFFETGSFAFSRQGLTHELKREDTFFLRFGFNQYKNGKSSSLRLEKIMTEKEVEYRTRLNDMFKEGSTVDVVKEFQKIVDEIKTTPNQTRKEKAILDACLAFALYKTGNAKAAGVDDLDPDNPLHGWRSDIDVCLLRLNLKFLSFLEKSIVPTSNANVDRTNRMHKYGRIIATGYDYRINMSKNDKIVLSYEGEDKSELKKGDSWWRWPWAPKVAHQEVKGIDKIVVCGGRSNYDKTGRNGGIKFPETDILGDPNDPTLQSMATELGNFPLTPDGNVLPFMMTTSSWIPLQALIGSPSLYGYKGTLAAFKDSAKLSLLRAQESATTAGALINIKSNDQLRAMVASLVGIPKLAEPLSPNEFNNLVSESAFNVDVA